MLCLLVQLSLSAQDFTARIGIYDFTDEAAYEFYVIAPTVIFGYDCLKMSRLTLNVSAGFSFNSFKYQSKKHNLYMVPLFVSMLYELTNPESKVHPYIGGGFSLLGKADKNQTLKMVHYSFTYGYHAIGGLYIDFDAIHPYGLLRFVRTSYTLIFYDKKNIKKKLILNSRYFISK
jgi:hypothetical protein